MKFIRVKTIAIVSVVAAFFFLHVPLAFSRDIPARLLRADEISSTASSSILSTASALYDSLDLDLKGLSHEAFDAAVCGFEKLKASGKLANERILSICDFSKSSATKRLFIIDMVAGKVLFNTYVAHGMGSGAEMARSFSNVEESHQSSLGFYNTSSTYSGKHGYSLHLEGVERGFNDRAYDRAIVVHGADYVSRDFINAKGYLGRSHGCPAVPNELSKPIIDKIKGGSCLFIYAKNTKYLASSKLLNS